MKLPSNTLNAGLSLLVVLSTFFLPGAMFAEEGATGRAPLILDMVHHNVGCDPYESAYNDPAVIKKMGFNGKVYYLFDSPTLAINWESVDPDILPKGSKARNWVEKKAERIKAQHAACRAQGIATYAMADLVLFPTRLIEKYNIQKTFGDPKDPQTRKFLRAQVDEMFKQFPDLDGLVVRIGETYLEDAPYHKGSIHNKQNAEKTIIPLMQLLREEVCVKRNKQLIFRTWWAFDENLNTYTSVSKSVEPHENLVLGIKHCEGDFFRSHPFSKVIGEGRHRHIIEVQCAREYEGKGAYPNYIAHGVIEGFEEHAGMPENRINSIREFTEKKPELFAGIWTWTRGGGWDGPYIKNEMWCDLNAWVMAQWALDTTQSEEAVFNRYAKERLGLKGDSIKAFRKLCLLSADAVVRGRYSIQRDMPSGWTRDHCIGWPPTPKDKIARTRNLRQKDESVAMWKEVVTLAESIQWPDAKTRSHAIGSSYYSLRLYDIYRSLVYLSDAEHRKDEEAMRQWIQVYDTAWATYKKLPEQYPELATLYDENYARYTRPTAHSVVNKLRARVNPAGSANRNN